jgi:hypothetical protein
MPDAQKLALTPAVEYPARRRTSGRMRDLCAFTIGFAAAGVSTLPSAAARGSRPVKIEACDGTVHGAVA